MGDIAVSIFLAALPFNHQSATQPDPLTQYQALELLVCLFAEVGLIDEELTAHHQLPAAKGWISRVIRYRQHKRLSEVGQGQPKWPHDTHRPGRVLVKMIPDGALEHRHIDCAIRAGGAYLLTEMPDRGGGIPSAAQPCDGRHAGVVPSGDDLLVHQLLQFALAGDGIAGIQPRELNLSWLMGHRQIRNKPIVKRPVVLELQRADRMGNPLNCVFLPMSKVVRGIDWPLRTRLMMGRVANAIQNGVTQIHIARGHIDLGSQHPLTVSEFSSAHALK